MNGDIIFTIIIIVLILLSVFYVFRTQITNLYVGIRKNARIKSKLKSLVNDYDYLYLNNLCLRIDAGKYLDIDHVVFGDKFIYVISTKFWLGYVNGSDEDEKWLLGDGEHIEYVENPLKYNMIRIRALSSILDLSLDNFMNVVCIAKCAKIKEVTTTNRSNAVLSEKELLEFIKFHEKNANVNVYKTEEIEKLAEKLYDYHKASLEDKSYYTKNKARY